MSSTAPRSDAWRREICVCTLQSRDLPESEEGATAPGWCGPGTRDGLTLCSPFSVHRTASAHSCRETRSLESIHPITGCLSMRPALWVHTAQPPGTARWVTCPLCFRLCGSRDGGEGCQGSQAGRRSTIWMREAVKCYGSPRRHPPLTRRSAQTQDVTRTREGACDLTSCQHHLSWGSYFRQIKTILGEGCSWPSSTRFSVPTVPCWPSHFQVTLAPSLDSPAWGLMSSDWSPGLVTCDLHIQSLPPAAFHRRALY